MCMQPGRKKAQRQDMNWLVPFFWMRSARLGMTIWVIPPPAGR